MKDKMIRIFETHAHYDDKQYDSDRDKLLLTLKNSGIDKIVNISYDLKSMENTISLTKKYDFIYGALGYHPCDCKDINYNDLDNLRKLAYTDKIVAIGEIGLDYYWDEVDKDTQKKWFIEQIKLANEKKLPIVVHSRDAAEDTYNIVKKYGKGRGIIHCFSYSAEMAEQFIKLGYHIGLGGVVTFKNSKNIKKVVENIPIESLVIETDCPYLTPEPFRGKRNSSAYLIYVLEKIAEIKKMTVEEVANITYENAVRVYGL